MRIIIDGTVGCGKTSLILGESQRDSEHKRFHSLVDLGYPVFTDLVINVIKQLREEGISDPSQAWDIFFEIAVNHCIDNFNAAKNGIINFYDRGIFFLEILANRYGQKLPNQYKVFCDNFHYDNPVFIFEPIRNQDMTHPHKTDNKQKIYTWEERCKQHKDVIRMYQSYGYNTIVVPLGSDDAYESNKFRMQFIKSHLGIL